MRLSQSSVSVDEFGIGFAKILLTLPHSGQVMPHGNERWPFIPSDGIECDLNWEGRSICFAMNPFETMHTSGES
jgi:hypothetical protein